MGTACQIDGCKWGLQVMAVHEVRVGRAVRARSLLVKTLKARSCSPIQRPVSMAPARNVRPALCQLDSLVATNERTGKEGRDVPPSNGTDWSWTPRSPPADRQPVSVHAVLT